MCVYIYILYLYIYTTPGVVVSTWFLMAYDHFGLREAIVVRARIYYKLEWPATSDLFFKIAWVARCSKLLKVGVLKSFLLDTASSFRIPLQKVTCWSPSAQVLSFSVLFPACYYIMTKACSRRASIVQGNFNWHGGSWCHIELVNIFDFNLTWQCPHLGWPGMTPFDFPVRVRTRANTLPRPWMIRCYHQVYQPYYTWGSPWDWCLKPQGTSKNCQTDRIGARKNQVQRVRSPTSWTSIVTLLASWGTKVLACWGTRLQSSETTKIVVCLSLPIIPWVSQEEYTNQLLENAKGEKSV